MTTTEPGPARAAQNALKHGIFSSLPVLPGLEREADWLAHREGIVESLAPEGYLEETLAESAALLFWRLARVARYETAILTHGLEAVDRRPAAVDFKTAPQAGSWEPELVY